MRGHDVDSTFENKLRANPTPPNYLVVHLAIDLNDLDTVLFCSNHNYMWNTIAPGSKEDRPSTVARQCFQLVSA